jgi:hypothetical protein
VTGLVKDEALMFLGSAQDLEPREMRSLYGTEEIETAIRHQDWDIYPRRKVQLVHFRK